MWKISFNLIFSFSLARSLFVTYQVAKCFKLLLLKSRGFKNIKNGNSSKIPHPQILSEFRTVVRFFLMLLKTNLISKHHHYAYRRQSNAKHREPCYSGSPFMVDASLKLPSAPQPSPHLPPSSPGKNAAYWSAMPALCPCEMRACIYNVIIVDPRLPEL